LHVQKTFRGSEKDAREEMARLVADAAENRFDRSRATVGQLLDRWLEHIGATRRPSMIAGYRAKIDHALRPAFGHIPVSKFGADDLDARYRSWLDQGLAPATVTANTTPSFQPPFTRPSGWGWIERSVARRASPPTVRTAPMMVPTAEQLTEMVRLAETYDPVLATAVALAAPHRLSAGRTVRPAVVRRRLRCRGRANRPGDHCRRG
jgi:hypothetical protein